MVQKEPILKAKIQPSSKPTNSSKTNKKQRKKILAPTRSCFSALHFQINHQKDFNLYCTSFHLRTSCILRHRCCHTVKASTPVFLSLHSSSYYPVTFACLPSSHLLGWLLRLVPSDMVCSGPLVVPFSLYTQGPGIPPQCISYFACQVHTNIQVTKYLAEAT